MADARPDFVPLLFTSLEEYVEASLSTVKFLAELHDNADNPNYVYSPEDGVRHGRERELRPLGDAEVWRVLGSQEAALNVLRGFHQLDAAEQARRREWLALALRSRFALTRELVEFAGFLDEVDESGVAWRERFVPSHAWLVEHDVPETVLADHGVDAQDWAAVVQGRPVAATLVLAGSVLVTGAEHEHLRTDAVLQVRVGLGHLDFKVESGMERERLVEVFEEVVASGAGHVPDAEVMARQAFEMEECNVDERKWGEVLEMLVTQVMVDPVQRETASVREEVLRADPVELTGARVGELVLDLLTVTEEEEEEDAMQESDDEMKEEEDVEATNKPLQLEQAVEAATTTGESLRAYVTRTREAADESTNNHAPSLLGLVRTLREKVKAYYSTAAHAVDRYAVFWLKLCDRVQSMLEEEQTAIEANGNVLEGKLQAHLQSAVKLWHEACAGKAAILVHSAVFKRTVLSEEFQEVEDAVYSQSALLLEQLRPGRSQVLETMEPAADEVENAINMRMRRLFLFRMFGITQAKKVRVDELGTALATYVRLEFGQTHVAPAVMLQLVKLLLRDEPPRKKPNEEEDEDEEDEEDEQFAETEAHDIVTAEQWTRFMMRFGPLQCTYKRMTAVCTINDGHVAYAPWFCFENRDSVEKSLLTRAKKAAKSSDHSATQPLFCIRPGKGGDHVFSLSHVVYVQNEMKVSHSRIKVKALPEQQYPHRGVYVASPGVCEDVGELVRMVASLLDWPHVQDLLTGTQAHWRKTELSMSFERCEADLPSEHLAALGGRVGVSGDGADADFSGAGDVAEDYVVPNDKGFFPGYTKTLAGLGLVTDGGTAVPVQRALLEIHEMLQKPDLDGFVAFCKDDEAHSLEVRRAALSSFWHGLIVHKLVEISLDPGFEVDAEFKWIPAVLDVFRDHSDTEDLALPAGRELFRTSLPFNNRIPAETLVAKSAALLDGENVSSESTRAKKLLDLLANENLLLPQDWYRVLSLSIRELHVDLFEHALDHCKHHDGPGPVLEEYVSTALVDEDAGHDFGAPQAQMSSYANLFHVISELEMPGVNASEVETQAYAFGEELLDFVKSYKGVSRHDNLHDVSRSVSYAGPGTAGWANLESWQHLVDERNGEGKTPVMIAAEKKRRKLVMFYVRNCSASFDVLDDNDLSLFNYVLRDLDSWLTDKPDDNLFHLFEARRFKYTINHRAKGNHSPLFTVMSTLKQLETDNSKISGDLGAVTNRKKRIRVLEKMTFAMLEAGALLGSLDGHQQESDNLKTDLVNRLVSRMANGSDDSHRWTILRSAVRSRDTELVRRLLASSELPYFFEPPPGRPYTAPLSPPLSRVPSLEPEPDMSRGDGAHPRSKIAQHAAQEVGKVRRPLQGILHCAVGVRDQDPELVELLLTYFAPPRHVKKTTARVVQAGKRAGKSRDRRRECLRPNANAIDIHGRTALHLVAMQVEPSARSLEVTRKLIAHVDIMAKDWRGCTALHYAAQTGNLEMVRLLLEAHADPAAVVTPGTDESSYKHAKSTLKRGEVRWVKSKDGSRTLGMTPLHMAAECGHWQVVAELLRGLGAAGDKEDDLSTETRSAVDPIDNNGHTPLFLALKRFNVIQDMVKLIEQHDGGASRRPSVASDAAPLMEQPSMSDDDESVEPGAGDDVEDVEDVDEVSRASMVEMASMASPADQDEAAPAEPAPDSTKAHIEFQLVMLLLMRVDQAAFDGDCEDRKGKHGRKNFVATGSTVLDFPQIGLDDVRQLSKEYDNTAKKLLASGASITTATKSAGCKLSDLIDVESKWKKLSLTIQEHERAAREQRIKGKRLDRMHDQKIEELFDDRQNQIVINRRYNDKVWHTLAGRLVLYVVFLVLATVLAVHEATRDELSAHYFHEGLEQTLIRDEFPHNVSKLLRTYNDIDEPAEWYMWLRGPFLDALYPESREYWDGTNRVERDGGFVNQQVRLIGVPRLRQLRSKETSCDVPAGWKHVDSTCFSDVGDPSTASFGPAVAGVGPWNYSGEDDLDGVETWGRADWYCGGGHTQELPPPVDDGSREQAMRLVDVLEQSGFIDTKTRAVFVEFSAYDASENFFAVCNVMLEFPRSGGAVPSATFDIVPVRRYVDQHNEGFIGLEILVVVVVVIYTARQYRSCCSGSGGTKRGGDGGDEADEPEADQRFDDPEEDDRKHADVSNEAEQRERCVHIVELAEPGRDGGQMERTLSESSSYDTPDDDMRVTWKTRVCMWFMRDGSIVECCMHVSFLLLVIFRIINAVEASGVNWDAQREYVPLQRLGRFTKVEVQLWSVFIFFAWFKMFSYVKLFRRLSRLLIMIEFMLADLVDFAMLLALVLVAFASAEYVAYGYTNPQAPTWFYSFVSHFSDAFSGREVNGRNDTDRLLGVVFPMLFVIVVSLLMMNLLIAILTNAYERARTRAGNSHWARWQYNKIRSEHRSPPLLELDKCSRYVDDSGKKYCREPCRKSCAQARGWSDEEVHSELLKKPHKPDIKVGSQKSMPMVKDAKQQPQ